MNGNVGGDRFELHESFNSVVHERNSADERRLGG